MMHDPATVRVCQAIDAADENIVWHRPVVLAVLPSDEELREQERARRRAWQARRFEQLQEMLR